MSFFTPSKDTKVQIDFDYYKPVKVIWCCESNGKITPMRFIVSALDESEEAYDVIGVTQTKEYRDRIFFRCLFTHENRQQAIILEFYIEDHVWVTPR